MVTLIKTRQKSAAWLNTVKGRLAALDHHAALDPAKDCDRDTARSRPPAAPVLGILSFEAARSMSRLISLHRSLADPEISSLRSSTMRSKGVAYLNSVDQPRLLRLACAEMLQNLDLAAEAVSRLSSAAGGRCKVAKHQLGPWAPDFRRQYEQLKMGRLLLMPATNKDVDKKVKKMARYVRITATLHEEMETLAEMEASERKLQRWRDYSGPITTTTTTAAADSNPAAPSPLPSPSSTNQPPGADLFLKRLAIQRRKVRRIQEDSLWGETTDRVVHLMAQVVVAVFARICSVFSTTVVTHLPLVTYDRDGRPRFSPKHPFQPTYVSSSGPLERNPPPPMSVISSSGPLFNRGAPPGMIIPQPATSGPILRPTDPDQAKPWTARELEAPPTTVGGAGLARRYADVVDLAERMLMQPDCVRDDTREELYRLLPAAIRAAVRQKLLRNTKPASADVNLAQGWRDAACRILDWLAPMAHDTIKWHSERSCERQRIHPVSEEPHHGVLLLQTLYFSDRDKAEAAIVEVLVGLSCVCSYQYASCFQRDPSSADHYDDDDFLNLD